MSVFTPADSLHRLVKQVLDSGAASSIAEAQALFDGYQLALRLGQNQAHDRHHQAALLTAVALARRVFLGGVTVAVAPDTPLVIPMPLGRTLGEAVTALGGRVAPVPDSVPLIEIGGETGQRQTSFHVRAFFAGWRAGVLPTHVTSPSTTGPVMHLAPMLAAALAVNEAFLFVSGTQAVAGRRNVGLSLWNPATHTDWLDETGNEPTLELLPSRLWLIGLGHLGQAYLWALGLLPYADPRKLHLVLQDIDVITPSTESTSVLSDATLIGQKKTRAMAAWADGRGFDSAIHERLFDRNFRRHPDEPAVALCGLDNGLGRQALDLVGFDFVVEAGLGRGHRDFRAVRLHTLPASRPASAIWSAAAAQEEVRRQPAYEGMLARGEMDRCGVTLLAGKAVGAPFVGSVAACLAISEILRLLHGGIVHEVIDLDLKCPDYRSVVPTGHDFSRLNPGFVTAGE